jgi:hypothetical protein
MPDYIALLGAAGTGKDTVAERLVTKHGYMRLAFADPLKELALDADPLIPTGGKRPVCVRLSALVHEYGWDHCKTTYPEVRRTLQALGQGIRGQDEDFWLMRILPKVLIAAVVGARVVVADVRYRNEADSLNRAGFTLVRVDRPDLSGGEAFREHPSETDVADYEVHHTIVNDGPLSYLYKQVETLTV